MSLDIIYQIKMVQQAYKGNIEVITNNVRAYAVMQ